MKPFKINRNSWHYRLNKNFFNEDEWFMEERWERKHSNFCAYWRATVFRMLGVSLMAGGVTMMVLALVTAIAANPVAAAVSTAIIIGLVALAFALGYWYEMRKKDQVEQEEAPKSLVGQWLYAKKSKICPMVEFNE